MHSIMSLALIQSNIINYSYWLIMSGILIQGLPFKTILFFNNNIFFFYYK